MYRLTTRVNLGKVKWGENILYLSRGQFPEGRPSRSPKQKMFGKEKKKKGVGINLFKSNGQGPSVKHCLLSVDRGELPLGKISGLWRIPRGKGPSWWQSNLGKWRGFWGNDKKRFFGLHPLTQSGTLSPRTKGGSWGGETFVLAEKKIVVHCQKSFAVQGGYWKRNRQFSIRHTPTPNTKQNPQPKETKKKKNPQKKPQQTKHPPTPEAAPQETNPQISERKRGIRLPPLGRWEGCVHKEIVSILDLTEWSYCLHRRLWP